MIALAQERLLQNPNHLQSLAALAWAYGRTDQAALERQACAQLVRKAEAVGVHPDAPTLASARQTLHAAVWSHRRSRAGSGLPEGYGRTSGA